MKIFSQMKITSTFEDWRSREPQVKRHRLAAGHWDILVCFN